MIARNESGIWLAAVVAITCALLIVVALSSVTQPALADLPPRPTAKPIESGGSAPSGAMIELLVQFPTTWPWDKIHWQDLQTVVQWQDEWGHWHDVEGWQGELDGVVIGEGEKVVGKKMWWVAGSDLGKGPFRWLVTQGKGGNLLATSASFDLPGVAGQSAMVEVSPTP